MEDKQTEIKDETKEEDKPTEDTGTGDEPKTSSILEQTDARIERFEKATDERSKVVAREEVIVQRQMLGGGSEAGKPVEKKEETNKEYVDRMRANGWRAEG